MRNFIFISPHFPDSYWKFCMALKSHGFNVLGIGDAPYYELPEQCKYALEEYYVCSFMDIFDNERRAVEYFKNKYGEIEYIESNNEYWLLKDSKLRDIFNVKTSFNEQDLSWKIKKSNQKEYFIKAGLKPARFCISRDHDILKDFIDKVGFPIFTKPNIGMGAQGTKRLDNEVELFDYVSSLPSDKEYIFEEYIDGDLYSYDGITNSKGEVVFETGHSFSVPTAEIANKRLDGMYYCFKELPSDLKEKGRRAVEAFNLNRRFFHFEFFRLKNDHPYLGKKGDLVPLEANFRVAGAYTPDLIDFANSIDVYQLYADIMAYDENRQNMDLEKYFAISCHRRNYMTYRHNHDEIVTNFKDNLCYFGEFPKALRDDMGDYFYVAKFKDYDEMMRFNEYIHEKE